MALETVTNIADLVETNPVNATDDVSEGDDHIRNIKTALLTDLPNITGPITATQAEINLLTGIGGDVVSTTDTQVITDKTLTAPVINNPTLTLTQSAAPTPTAEGLVEWGTDDNALKVGDGADTQTFSPDSISKTWELIETITASASASVDFETNIDSSYSLYMIEMLRVVPATDGTVLQLQVGTGATPTYQTGTVYENNTLSSVTITGTGVGNAAGESLSGRIMAYDPSNTATFTLFASIDGMYNTSTGSPSSISGTGSDYTATTAVTAFRILFASGNITSGVFNLYGFSS